MARPNMRQGGPGSMPVPFPFAHELSHKGTRRADFVHATDNAPLKQVPIKQLIATQKSVDPKEVEQFISEPPMVTNGKRSHGGLLIDHPVVVKRDGRLLIHDGHHRLSAAKTRGDEEATVRLVDLDAHKNSKKSGLHMWAKGSE